MYTPQTTPSLSLRSALRTVHRDRDWWKKVLIGGAISLTVIGYPIVEGHQIESIDNTNNGYPTPLPRWNDLGGKAIQGVFALVIDFFYFVFPLLLSGILLLCGALGVSIASTGGNALRALGGTIGVIISAWLVLVWLSSASPVGKRLYVGEGQPNQALSRQLLASIWEQPARVVYFKARLLSLPIYLPSIALFVAAWWSSATSGWIALIVLWLALAALLYARLVTIQLYDAAARELQRLRFEAFRARTRS